MTTRTIEQLRAAFRLEDIRRAQALQRNVTVERLRQQMLQGMAASDDASPDKATDLTGMDYLLVCRQCASDSKALPVPFESAQARGQWAAEHTRGTGHVRWLVMDKKQDDKSGDVQ